MEINKIYDVLKSKYDVVSYDEFIILMDGLRNAIKYFVEFSFDNENIWCKLSFPDPEFQKLLIMVYISGNQFTKDNIKTIEDENKKYGAETKGIVLSFRMSASPENKLTKITVPLSMLYLSKDQAKDQIFTSIMQILFNELVKQRTEIENRKAKEKELKEEIQLKDNNCTS